ncbi:MAG: bifunctional folylpolyglutamate synthase/dihydrofolate synthase, partial [Thermus sp.]
EGALGPELGTPFFEDPREALEEALARAREDGAPVLATGSLYLVGRLLAVLGQDPARGVGEDHPADLL